MNIIAKGQRTGSVNEIKKALAPRRKERSLDFAVGKSSRSVISSLLVVCGKVGRENAALYEKHSREIGADFVLETGRSWVLAQQTIRKNYKPGVHQGVLLIGTNKELPSTQIAYQGSYAFSDWFIQDVDGDGIPDVPVGRIFGPPETVLYHMDPMIIDSNIAVVFDSEPGRSTRHVEALAKLGFDVEVLRKFAPEDVPLLSVSEFILQFSDGTYTSRIHGTPDVWASHNSLILTHQQAASIKFKGYPVIYSEACSTAREGLLVRAFLDQGACYIGSSLDTVNNLEPFDDWRACAYADGYKFGFLDLLDSKDLIGKVKLGVDRAIYENLESSVKAEIEAVRNGMTTEIKSDKALSTVEWLMYGNPLRRTAVGPSADFSPGRIPVDT